VTTHTPVPVSHCLAEIPHTPEAVWLRPSAWPPAAWYLFEARPFDTDTTPPVISRYDAVLAVMLNPHIWQRQIPRDVLPEDDRHCVVDASWLTDGEEHDLLRGSVQRINRGSTDAARQFTVTLTRQLLAELMDERPPWNLSRVLDGVSMRVIIEHTLQAPPLLPYAARLRTLYRECSAAPGAQRRQEEVEEILGLVLDHPADLPNGLARHLADLCGKHRITKKQLVSQLCMLTISYETQATIAENLIGLLLEHGLLAYAAQALQRDDLTRRLVDEGIRRGIAFPANLITPTVPVTIDERTVPAGEPVLISYAAANMDRGRFGETAQLFDPRIERPPHLAFGEGRYRCLGEKGVKQFVADVLEAALAALPPGAQLGHGGRVLREPAGVSWTIPELPVSP
jgi:cytochrome P450